jgi:hypothetical protein
MDQSRAELQPGSQQERQNKDDRMDPGIFLCAQYVADPCEGMAKGKQSGPEELAHGNLD